MSTPQVRKTKTPKPRIQGPLKTTHESIRPNPSAPSPLPSAAAPPNLPKPNVADLTFEDYKSMHLNIDEQHSLIGQIRGELPIIDRDEVDDALLRSLALQLELCIFPTCKMMQVDPAAVKRMLDDSFRMAYGTDVDAEVLARNGAGRMEKGVQTMVVDGEDEEDDGVMDGKCQTRRGSRDVEYPNKKVKKTPLSEIGKQVKAYETARKRARRPCRIVTLSSKSASETWEVLRRGG